MADKATMIAALRENWKREMEGARTYRNLAAGERDADRGRVLLQLAEAEERHAVKWQKRLADLGAPPPQMVGGWRERVRQRWLRLLGTETALAQIEAEEERDIARYAQHMAAFSGDTDAVATLREVRVEEKAHRRWIFSTLRSLGPQGALHFLLKRERHVGGGSWIGDAIYGANDGLGAVYGIVAGVAGATGGSHVVVIAGLAGALASALSMGSGAYLASKSERELHEAEIQRERTEIEENPEEEQEELELFYQLKGFTADEAKLLTSRLAEQPEQMLKTLAHEELGLSEAAFPNPWIAALSATVSTALGAIIPVVPFFFTAGIPAIWASFVVSTLAHFAVGAAKALVTTRPWWYSGLEMTIVGLIVAGATYGLGTLLGVPV